MWWMKLLRWNDYFFVFSPALSFLLLLERLLQRRQQHTLSRSPILWGQLSFPERKFQRDADAIRGGRPCAASSWAPVSVRDSAVTWGGAPLRSPHHFSPASGKDLFSALNFHKFNCSVSWLAWISLGLSCLAFAQPLESAGLCLSCG